VITVAALVSHPPLLLRDLVGAEDPVADLRAAALDAVRALAGAADRVVVVGPAEEDHEWDVTAAVDARRFGGPGERPCRPGLPLSLGVGARLLQEGGWTGSVALRSITGDVAAAELDALVGSVAQRPGRTGLLLLGDGSARRGPKAPGYVDERAFGWDDAVAAALADGDAATLAGLDVRLAEELMAHGAPVFRLLGAVGLRCGPAAAARTALTYRGDPYGVTYYTALWHFPTTR
jgi:hypothetical protein